MQSLSFARSHRFLLHVRPPARLPLCAPTKTGGARARSLARSHGFLLSSALRARPRARKTAVPRTLCARAAKQHLLRRCMQLLGMQKLGIYASILVFYILQNITAYHTACGQSLSLKHRLQRPRPLLAARANSPTAAAARRSSRLTRTALWNRYNDICTRN